MELILPDLESFKTDEEDSQYLNLFKYMNNIGGIFVAKTVNFVINPWNYGTETDHYNLSFPGTLKVLGNVKFYDAGFINIGFKLEVYGDLIVSETIFINPDIKVINGRVRYFISAADCRANESICLKNIDYLSKLSSDFRYEFD